MRNICLSLFPIKGLSNVLQAIVFGFDLSLSRLSQVELQLSAQANGNKCREELPTICMDAFDVFVLVRVWLLN